MTKTATIHVALLRSINVGGRNKLPMKDLAAIFTEAGCRDVKTYIQSGNVVFEAEDSLARRLPKSISTAILERFGYHVPVVMRTAEALVEVVEGNPFLEPDIDIKKLHVAFLADRPTEERVSALDTERSSPDELALHGREIYLRLPNGVARTKLTNKYFDSKLATTSTVRNWKTVLKLVEMTAG